MIYILLILAILLTFCLPFFVINFCRKYIQNLRQTFENKINDINVRNEIAINSLQKMWKEIAELREKEFVEKLKFLTQNGTESILSEYKHSSEILVIPCYETRLDTELGDNLSQKFEQNALRYQNRKIIFSQNVMNLNVEQIEQMLVNNLATYLIEKKFVKGKYNIRDGFVEFVCNFYHRIN